MCLQTHETMKFFLVAFVCMVYLCGFSRVVHCHCEPESMQIERNSVRRTEPSLQNKERAKPKQKQKLSMRNSENPAPTTMIQDNGNLHLLRKMNNETHSLRRLLIHFKYVYQNAWMCTAQRSDVFCAVLVCLFNGKSKLSCHILSSSPFFFKPISVHIFAACDYAKYEEKNNFTQILAMCGCNNIQNNAKRKIRCSKRMYRHLWVKWKTHTHAHTIRCVIQLTWNTFVVHRSPLSAARKETHTHTHTRFL